MVGNAWTNRSLVVRLTFAAPPLLVLVAPLSRTVIVRSIGITAAVGCTLLVIAWTAYVVRRVTMNAHRRGGLYDEAR